MARSLLIIALMLLLTLSASAQTPATAPMGRARWTPAQANDWYAHQPWFCGFNYFPCNAENSTEIWQAQTFDPKTIDAELALAQKTGFNCVRVFLQFIVWEDDAAGLKKRMNAFLKIADAHHIRVMFVLFDDCWFGTQGPEPKLGKQWDPIPGEYASGFTGSPGPARVRNAALYPKLEAYVKDIVGTFKDDPRVFLWDLYNEVGNGGLGPASFPLAKACFIWARSVNPTQPLSICNWKNDGEFKELTTLVLTESDIITFHNYQDAPGMRKEIDTLKKEGRPLICTEWLNRERKSTVADVLPVLAEQNVGALHWGFVNGKTQTHLWWGDKAGTPDHPVWQHDLYHTNLTPYDQKELDLFQSTIAAKQGANK